MKKEFGYEWTHTDGTKRAILCVYSEKAGLWCAIISDGKHWCLAEDGSYSKSWGAIATLINGYKDNLLSHGLNPQPCKVEDYEASYNGKRKEHIHE